MRNKSRKLSICDQSNQNFLFDRYRELKSTSTSVVWLWEILESLDNEERVLFLRFVSGRSRLPANIADFPQKLQIIGIDKVCLIEILLLISENCSVLISFRCYE